MPMERLPHLDAYQHWRACPCEHTAFASRRDRRNAQNEDGAERRRVFWWLCEWTRWRCLNFSAVEGSAAGAKWIRYVVHIGTHSTRDISCSQLTSRARRTRAGEVSLTQQSGGVRGGLASQPSIPLRACPTRTSTPRCRAAAAIFSLIVRRSQPSLSLHPQDLNYPCLVRTFHL